MTGKELFKSYLNKRDDYARVLMVGFNAIGEEFYDLLEKAEGEGKQITLREAALDAPSEAYPILI